MMADFLYAIPLGPSLSRCCEMLHALELVPERIRTAVRESSATGSTCLVQSIIFSRLPPEGQGVEQAIPVRF